MPYVLVASFSLGLALGFTAGELLQSSRVTALKVAIEKANGEARTKLAEAQQAVINATEQAAQFNIQLETAHEQNVSTINALRDRLSTAGLPTCSENRRNTVPARTGANAAANATEHTELPRDFVELVKSESYRADQVAEYAKQCWQFVTNNCGIKQ